MARNSNTRRPTPESTDRALPRAGADSWRALASATVTSALVMALIVSALALLEAVLSKPALNLAQRSPGLPETPAWRASALQPVLYSPFCARFERASCDYD